FVRWRSKFADKIQPLTFAVSLNVAQSGSKASISSILLPTNNTSFGSFRAAYQLYRPYNPQDQTFLDNWRKAVVANKALLNDTGRNIAEAINTLLTSNAQAIADNLAGPQSEWRRAGAAAERDAN